MPHTQHKEPIGSFLLIGLACLLIGAGLAAAFDPVMDTLEHEKAARQEAFERDYPEVAQAHDCLEISYMMSIDYLQARARPYRYMCFGGKR